MASLALARHEPAGAPKRLEQARTHAKSLGRERHPLSRGAAALVQAALAHHTGDRPRALKFLEAAISGYDSAEMSLRANVARRRLGELLGGTRGQELARAADATMRAQGIHDVERWTRMYSAAFPGPEPAPRSE